MLIILIVVILLVIIIGMAVSTQRNLVQIDEFCGNAMSQIGVQQTSRWDALTNLAKLTKDYSEFEYKSLMDIIASRKGISTRSTASDALEQDNLMDQLTAKIFAIGEAYPDLKANSVYLSTMDSLNDYENKVRISRMTYNDTVTKFNRIVRQFPSCLFAGMFHFTVRDYLEADANKTDMPKM